MSKFRRDSLVIVQFDFSIRGDSRVVLIRSSARIRQLAEHWVPSSRLLEYLWEDFKMMLAVSCNAWFYFLLACCPWHLHLLISNSHSNYSGSHTGVIGQFIRTPRGSSFLNSGFSIGKDALSWTSTHPSPAHKPPIKGLHRTFIPYLPARQAP